MAAHAERWSRQRKVYGRVAGCSMRHQGCAGESAPLVQIENGLVHARGQAKIVGVYNQSLHPVESTKPIL
jgi:hypothetical protein